MLSMSRDNIGIIVRIELMEYDLQCLKNGKPNRLKLIRNKKFNGHRQDYQNRIKVISKV